MEQNYSNLPSRPNLVTAFLGPVTNTGLTTDWQVWTKPDNISLIMIIAIGGGGGGGRGYSSTTTTQSAGGGGGGGPGAVYKTLYTSELVPNTLYVKPGIGGKGASYTAGSTGGGGSYVATAPAINATLYLAQAAGGTGGGNGTATAGGSIGSFGSLSNQNTMESNAFGMYFTSNSPPPTYGSLAANAASVNLVSPSAVWINIFATGGAGGGGIDNSIPPAVAYNGGNINLPPSILSSLNASYANNIISGGAGGTNGLDGGDGLNYGITLVNNLSNLNLQYPLISTGGAGGGASTGNSANYAGRGGHGGIGSGGGGGGGALPATAGTGVSPGIGGDGGPGLVLIVCA